MNRKICVGASIARPLSAEYLRDIGGAVVIDTSGRAMLAPTRILRFRTFRVKTAPLQGSLSLTGRQAEFFKSQALRRTTANSAAPNISSYHPMVTHPHAEDPPTRRG